MKLRKMAVGVVVASASITGIGIAAADIGTPPRPPWEATDGTMDVSKAPEWIPVLDGNGTLAGYSRWTDLYHEPQDARLAEPLREPPVKVYADKPGRIHIGWVVPGRGFQKGTQVPR